MKANRCFAIFIFVIIQFILLTGIFYLFYLILPTKVQDTFQRSFIRQKSILIKIDRKIINYLSYKPHNANYSSTKNDFDDQMFSRQNNEIQDNEFNNFETEDTNNFDYNAIITEIPHLQRSSQVHGFRLIIAQIIRAFYGLFHSTFYAIKSVMRILFSSIGSTVKYTSYRSQGVNIILTKLVLKIIIFLTKIFRFMTYWLKFLMKLGRTIIYKFF